MYVRTCIATKDCLMTDVTVLSLSLSLSLSPSMSVCSIFHSWPYRLSPKGNYCTQLNVGMNNTTWALPMLPC